MASRRGDRILSGLEDRMATGTVFFVHGSGNREADAKAYGAKLETGLKLQAGAVKLSTWGDSVGPDEKFPNLSKTMPSVPAGAFGETNADILADPYGPLNALAGGQGAFGAANKNDARLVLAFLQLGGVDLGDLRLPSVQLSAAAAEIVASPEFAAAAGDSARLIDAAVTSAAARAVQRQGGQAAAAGAFGFDPIGAVKRELAERLMGVATAAVAEVVPTFSPGILRWLSEQFAKRRPSLMQAHILVAADILFYQRHAPKIRQHVRDEIASIPAPRLVLGHSLGGIILVDTLFGPDASDLDVRLLVTFGSQSPLLQALEAFDKVEPTVPWLNIWTRFDFVSFLAEGLWPGKATDREIPNALGFPEAHGSYYDSADFYSEISKHPAAASFLS
jgi:hypothetical protein